MTDAFQMTNVTVVLHVFFPSNATKRVNSKELKQRKAKQTVDFLQAIWKPCIYIYTYIYIYNIYIYMCVCVCFSKMFIGFFPSFTVRKPHPQKPSISSHMGTSVVPCGLRCQNLTNSCDPAPCFAIPLRGEEEHTPSVVALEQGKI